MNRTPKNGFTIVELMLAMSFIAALLVAIAMTTIEISHIYTRGLTLREVNQVGRSASEDIQRSISASVPFDISTKYINHSNSLSGRLCLGRYSYVWNHDTALQNNMSDITYDDSTHTPVHLAKIDDPSAAWCTSPFLTSVPRASSTELLATGDRDLVVHKLSISSPASDVVSAQALYALSITIGTNDPSQLTAVVDPSCKPPADSSGNEDYCSVSQFDIVVRAGNKSGDQ